MKYKAVALWISKTRKEIGEQLIEACRRFDCELSAHGCSGYKGNYRAHENVITWGVKMPHWWYRRHWRNILFIENGLLCQRQGIWVDNGGWFSDSNMAKEGHYEQEVAPREYLELKEICRSRFHWDLLEGGNPDGPIMYAMQRKRDMSTFYFDQKKNDENVLLTGLKIVQKFLSDRHVVVRRHPRAFDELGEDSIRGCFGPRWELDASKNVYAALKNCSALVTVNSTLAIEAMSLGIPVATLGGHVYTGSGATLECSKDPSRLRELLSWRSSRGVALRCLCAVLRHQIPYGAPVDRILECDSFQRWVGRLK